MKIKLGELCKIQAGGTPSRSNPEYWKNGNIPWVKISDINSKYLDVTTEFITEEGLRNSSTKLIRKGSLLYTIFATLGEVCITNIDVTTNQAIAGISLTNDIVDVDYLYYYLKSLKQYVNSIGRGVAQNNINLTLLRNFEIPIIDKKSQVLIADSLTKIEKIIDIKKNQLLEYDQLIKSRFVEMFVDKYEKIQVSTKLRTTSGGTPKSDQSEYYANGTISWLTSGEVNQGRIEKTEKFITEKGLTNSSAKWIPKKSIVIAMYGATAGKVGIIEMPTTTNQAVCAVLPHDEYNPEYLRFAFEYISEELAGKAVGGGQPNISQAIIKDSLIFNPPLEVQIKFSAFVQHVDKLKFTVQKSLEETQTLFDSLMQKYFG